MKTSATIVIALLCLNFSTTAQRSAIPYFDNFESGAPGWTPFVTVQSGTNWELGTPTTGFTQGAYSGSKCWDVNLNDVYGTYAECFLLSPIFDFSDVTLAHISFWTKYKTEYLWDYLTVQYTVDNGANWSYLPFPNLINSEGFIDKWIKSSLEVTDLSGFAEVQFRFVFISDNSINYDGYSIDDFRIDADPLSAPDQNDAELFSFYPNPSDGYINFVFPANMSDEASVNILTLEGKSIFQSNAQSFSQQDLFLPKGIYSVVFDNGKESCVKKAVVTR